MLIDRRLTHGFYLATNRDFPPNALALLSRDYAGYGTLLLAFSGPADMEEYVVSWGFTEVPWVACEVARPVEIEGIAHAAKLAGIDGIAVNPPLDEREPQSVYTLEEVEEWARSKEEA